MGHILIFVKNKPAVRKIVRGGGGGGSLHPPERCLGRSSSRQTLLTTHFHSKVDIK